MTFWQTKKSETIIDKIVSRAYIKDNIVQGGKL